jgi:hypothetical protein
MLVAAIGYWPKEERARWRALLDLHPEEAMFLAEISLEFEAIAVEWDEALPEPQNRQPTTPADSSQAILGDPVASNSATSPPKSRK